MGLRCSVCSFPSDSDILFFCTQINQKFIRKFHITPHCLSKLCSISHVPFHTAHCTLNHPRFPTATSLRSVQTTFPSYSYLSYYCSKMVKVRKKKGCRKLSRFLRCYPGIISSNDGVNIIFMGQSRVSYFSRLLLRDD